MKGFLEIMMEWISTTLAWGNPQDKSSLTKLTYAINLASEEFLQCRKNMHQSIDGHLYVNKQQPFTKFKKSNKDPSSEVA